MGSAAKHRAIQYTLCSRPGVNKHALFSGTPRRNPLAHHAGQTGSGKTYTMEGFRYAPAPGHAAAASNGHPPPTRAASPDPHAAAGSRSLSSPTPARSERSVGNFALARSAHSMSARAQAPPVADFAGTPAEQLGIVPRVVEALFEVRAAESVFVGGGGALLRCAVRPVLTGWVGAGARCCGAHPGLQGPFQHPAAHWTSGPT